MTKNISANNTSNIIQLEPIGTLHSPFTDKFGIPRQANLIKSAQAEIELYPPYNNPDAFLGLENFSHIWLSFGFHLNKEEKWRPMIRPPRLGGNKKIGIFASRSPFRPNGLGQSLVELRELIVENNLAKLVIACPDLLDGTPIYDIKPYIHYADSNTNAHCGFAEGSPKQLLSIASTEGFEQNLQSLENHYPKELGKLIKEVISYDPRPAYKRDKSDDKVYKLRLYDLDISFKVDEGLAQLIHIEKQV